MYYTFSIPSNVGRCRTFIVVARIFCCKGAQIDNDIIFIDNFTPEQSFNDIFNRNDTCRFAVIIHDNEQMMARLDKRRQSFFKFLILQL